MDKELLKKTKLFRVGFITFISFVIFFYGMQFLQNENFQKSTISFKVVFKNSQGIDSGDEVWMLGKKIGFVTAAYIIFGSLHGLGLIINHSFRKLFHFEMNKYIAGFITFNYINFTHQKI